MNVLLIHPAESFQSFTDTMLLCEPLNLETIAAGLKHHDIEMRDFRVETDWKQALRKVLEVFRPGLIGITSLALTTPHTLQIAKEVKKYEPEAITVVGGKQPTFLPDDFNHPAIDLVVMGDGDYSFPAIAQYIEKAKDRKDALKKITSIKGVAIRDGGNLRLTEYRPPIKNLDALPFANRDISQKYRNHYSFLSVGRWMTMETSRGCPNRCEFCSVWKFNEGQYRCMSPRRVVDELHNMDESDFIFIIDDNLFANIPRASAIAKLFKEENVQRKFVIQAQPETVVRYPAVFEKWADIGLWGLFLGFESVNDAGMERIGADKSRKSNSAAVKILNELGINVSGSFIISPDYSRLDFEHLRRQIDDLRIVFLALYILTPYPGTELHKKIGKRYSIDEYRLFDGYHATMPTRLPLKEFYQEFSQLYVRFWKKNQAFLFQSSPLKESLNWYKRISRLYDDHSIKANSV